METKNAEAIHSSQHAHSRYGRSVSSFLPASARCIMIGELRWKIFELVALPDMPVSNILGRPSESSWETDDVDDEFSFMRESLLALALTCKSFAGPALDLLWRHLGGLEPLIKYLPQSLWKQDGKKLLFVTPKLTMLNISGPARHFYTTSSFFGPSEQSILSSIAKSCPSISHFNFNFVQNRDESTELVEHMSTVLQSWSRLISSRTGIVSEAAIPYLSKLPSLRVLKFTLPSTLISVDSSSPSLRKQFTATAATFQPLFTFRDLRKFNFTTYYRCDVRMDDADLVEMAKAWPLLEDLAIPGWPKASHEVTPHAFVSLLWHCPRLVSVAVPVDWTTIDYDDISRDIPYHGFSHNAVSKSVFRCQSELNNPISIAAFISAVAPNVTSIKGHESWMIVENMLAAISIIRQWVVYTTTTGLRSGENDDVNEGVSVDGSRKMAEVKATWNAFLLKFSCPDYRSRSRTLNESLSYPYLAILQQE
ncbi:hypothetical protein BDR07DRAFT_1464220 [Suillus spraguei]|nr:hypothetical protein BDR07DRAFT_1464220 [Suillus spraguei]